MLGINWFVKLDSWHYDDERTLILSLWRMEDAKTAWAQAVMSNRGRKLPPQKTFFSFLPQRRQKSFPFSNSKQHLKFRQTTTHWGGIAPQLMALSSVGPNIRNGGYQWKWFYELRLRMNPRHFDEEMDTGGRDGWPWCGGLFGFTCMLGRGRGRVPAQDLRSSSRARLSISNCLSCSRTEASREAVLAHCSIHTLRAEQSTGQERINTKKQGTVNQHRDLI